MEVRSQGQSIDNQEIVVRVDERCSTVIHHVPTKWKGGPMGGRKRNEKLLGGGGGKKPVLLGYEAFLSFATGVG